MSVSTETAQLVQMCGLSAPATILDIPCGPGRHALELARQGFLVTGDRVGISEIEGLDRRLEVIDLIEKNTDESH